MAIPETQLDTWSHQGSISQSSTTYATVRSALEAQDAGYADKDIDILLQGSYGNDTNIFAESDVDVVILMNDTYYFDKSALSEQERTALNANASPATYLYSEFKAHVLAALRQRFGTSDVTPGKKAIKIKASGNRRSADVVVAAQFRHYYSASLGPRYDTGICFFDSAGTRVVNYPKLHSANCTTKHQDSGLWFKPMVRIFKNLRSRLVNDGLISAGSAPSYFIEGLLYNVPNDKFATSYGDTFVAAMNWILKADRTKLVCANNKFYLTSKSAPERWPRADCDAFIDAAVKRWNDW